jgi:hypothetical protein
MANCLAYFWRKGEQRRLQGIALWADEGSSMSLMNFVTAL